MSNYKLIYFNARGRAEVCRFIFAQAGVRYEDKRVDRDEWAQLKPNTPTGLLPLLEVDGKQIPGSAVMIRFLGERLGFAGSNDVENAEIAGIVDVLHDFMLKLAVIFYEKDEGKKAETVDKLKNEDIPKYWGILEGYCRKNNSADGWIYGDKPTYADFNICCTMEYVTKFVPHFLEDYPCVSKMKAAVESLPNIADWIKKRPVTEM